MVVYTYVYGSCECVIQEIRQIINKDAAFPPFGHVPALRRAAMFWAVPSTLIVYSNCRYEFLLNHSIVDVRTYVPV